MLLRRLKYWSPLRKKIEAGEAENLLAKSFVKSGFQVIVCGQLTPSNWVTHRDLSEADKGDLRMLRKAAAFSDANLIFEARIKTVCSTEELLNMKLNKVVASISYKVLATVSGEILETDCRTYRDVSRSPDEARYGALKKMRVDIDSILIQKMANDLIRNDEKQMEKFRKSFKLPKRSPSSPAEQMSMPQNMASEDVKPPRIILLSPAFNERDLVLTLKNAELIEGQVEDESPLIFFRINNEDTEVDGNGYFAKTVVLREEDQKTCFRST